MYITSCAPAGNPCLFSFFQSFKMQLHSLMPFPGLKAKVCALYRPYNKAAEQTLEGEERKKDKKVMSSSNLHKLYT